HGHEQPVLGGVVVHDGALGDAEVAGDVAVVRRRVAVLGDAPGEGGDDVHGPACRARPATTGFRFACRRLDRRGRLSCCHRHAPTRSLDILTVRTVIYVTPVATGAAVTIVIELRSPDGRDDAGHPTAGL